MPELTNISTQRILNFIEEIREKIEPFELFTIIAPVTLSTLKSIEPNNDDFAHRIGDYINALQHEIAIPIIGLLKENLDRLEKACGESPADIPMAYTAVRNTLPGTFIFYDKMIRGRIRIFKRAETEGTRKPLPEPNLIPIPEKSPSELQEESNVKSLRLKRARTDLEKLKEATNRYAFHSQVAAGNLSIASRSNELSRFAPELPYIAQDYAESRDHLIEEMKNICTLAELALEEMEKRPLEKKNGLVVFESKNTESD